MLHELAHAIIGDEYADHGPEFARAWLQLTRRHLGALRALELERALDKHTVEL